MSAEVFVFFACAVICVVGALGVILAKNPVHSALMLVMTLFGVAVLFIAQEAYFLAAVQVIVYAGAIVVLFLFVIMLVGVDRAEDLRTEPVMGQRTMAAIVGVLTLALVVVFGVVVSGDVTGQRALLPIGESTIDPAADVVPDGLDVPADATEAVEVDSNVRQLGRLLFTDYVFATEITAILLTIAVVGAVMLARKPKGALQPIPETADPWIMRPAAAAPVVDADDAAPVDGASDAAPDGASEAAPVDGASEEVEA